jgi:hypothetical protein
MARYIDADKFAERIKLSPAFKNMGHEGDLLQRVVLDLLDNVPAVDVVEVVRCGKCKHWKNKRKGVLDEYVGECYNNDFPFHCEYRPIMQENAFCSYGERRDT